MVNGEVCGKPQRFARRETDTNAKRKHNRETSDYACGEKMTPILARRENATNLKRKHTLAKHDTSSIQAREVYAEHCARRGALSKANQAVTSNSVPNADPINIELLSAKHPEPAHPDRDPVRLSSILLPRPQT